MLLIETAVHNLLPSYLDSNVEGQIIYRTISVLYVLSKVMEQLISCTGRNPEKTKGINDKEYDFQHYRFTGDRISSHV